MPQFDGAVPRVRAAWYILAPVAQVTESPTAVRLFGEPLVVFRTHAGDPVVLLDRCAHRNVPLSAGRVVGNEIECPYHGWRFDREGICHHVPGLVGTLKGTAQVPQYACVESQGYVWVYGQEGITPERGAFVFPHLDDSRYSSIRYSADFDATLLATAENILDVPHTAFLHRGLFRGQESNEVEVQVSRGPGVVEAEYIGEPRPKGLIGRLLAPSGGKVRHVDRFLLPSIAQVEYQLGERSHIVVSNALTPLEAFRTRMHTVISFRLPLPHVAVKALVTPVAKKIVVQDARILAKQSALVQELGGEQFASTSNDVLAKHMQRMMRKAERGETDSGETEVVDTVRMKI